MRIATAIRSLVLAAAVSAIPAASFAGVFVSIGIGAPPVLPVYVQPVCPAAGYIWTPGYWAYDDEAGYYWVPGAWVLAPYTGALWTPGYWGWGNGGYLWHAGYWGRHVGFYGGVNYGFGYFGRGYEGGYWDHDRFRYNRCRHQRGHRRLHNVYNETRRQQLQHHARQLQRRSRRRQDASHMRSEQTLGPRAAHGAPGRAAPERDARQPEP